MKIYADFDLDGIFQEKHFNPEINSGEDWFTNSPKWLRRS